MKQLLFSILVAGATVFSSQQSQAQCLTAIELDGVDDYLHTPFANYTFTNFTIEMWINSADYLPNEVYVTWSQGTQVTLGGWAADGSFNSLGVGLSPLEANAGAGTALNPGNWHHVALVYDGSNRIYYIDGVLIATIPTSGALTTNPSNVQGLVIGANVFASQCTNTTFEDVRIWETARTQAEINANVIVNLSGSEPGLVAYYRFDDGYGSSTVTDLTGNGNDLTLMNMDPTTAWVPGVLSNSVQSTDVVSNCGPYTWVDGNTYSTDNNTATYTFTGGAVGGCDSIVTLDLTIDTPVDNSLTTTSSPTLSSNDTSAGVGYQWIDCGNGNAPLSGETNQDFTATTTGLYAVIVTGANGCVDTSSCFAVDFTSLDESKLISGVELSPNPTNGNLLISTPNNSGELTISVVDLMGKLIYQSTEAISPNNPATIDIADAEVGMYIVHVSGELVTRSISIVKK